MSATPRVTRTHMAVVVVLLGLMVGPIGCRPAPPPTIVVLMATPTSVLPPLTATPRSTQTPGPAGETPPLPSLTPPPERPAAPTAAPLPPTPTLPPPSVTLAVNPPVSEVTPGQTVALTLDIDGQGYSISWTVARGTLSASNTPAVIYTAPQVPGADTVTAQVANAGGVATRNVGFNVVRPTPTATPAAPTLSPAPPSPLSLIPPTPLLTPASPTPRLPAPGARSASPTPCPATLDSWLIESVQDYFTALNNRQYQLAWSRLSDEFKNKWYCCPPQGGPDFDEFVGWWDTVKRVVIRRSWVVEAVDPTALAGGSQAVVYAELAYLMKTGETLSYPQPYLHLVFDGANSRWLLYDKGMSSEANVASGDVSPVQAVRDYYFAVGEHLYDISWPMLSLPFRQRWNPPAAPGAGFDYAGYTQWWNQVRYVNVGQTSVVMQQDDQAVVYAELSYRLKSGETRDDPEHYIRLAFDRRARAWLFWDKGKTPYFE